jgi:hypothetical protein
LGLLPFVTSCDKNENLNLFSVADDLALGRQVDEQIESINEMAREINCNISDLNPASYQDFIALLP